MPVHPWEEDILPSKDKKTYSVNAKFKTGKRGSAALETTKASPDISEIRKAGIDAGLKKSRAGGMVIVIGMPPRCVCFISIPRCEITRPRSKGRARPTSKLMHPPVHQESYQWLSIHRSSSQSASLANNLPGAHGLQLEVARPPRPPLLDEIGELPFRHEENAADALGSKMILESRRP